MKINEAEALAGISKKNIRFYEEQGLLSPKRNNDNGYRDYGPEEIAVLRQIKLLRKLGVPLEEIRNMQSGSHTLGDGMRRHLVTLERERRNLEQAMALCRALQDRDEPLDRLDAGAVLEEMERLEGEGATFPDRQRNDRAGRYLAPAAVTAGMAVLMVGLMALLLWAFSVEEAAPPVPLMVLLVLLPAVVLLGVCLAFIQRVEEIRKGEVEDAKHY